MVGEETGELVVQQTEELHVTPQGSDVTLYQEVTMTVTELKERKHISNQLSDDVLHEDAIATQKQEHTENGSVTRQEEHVTNHCSDAVLHEDTNLSLKEDRVSNQCSDAVLHEDTNLSLKEDQVSNQCSDVVVHEDGNVTHANTSAVQLPTEQNTITEENYTCSSWPILNFAEPPERIYHFHYQFKRSDNNNFLKGAKWSPDGSCFIVSSEDNVLRIFDMPSDLSCYSSTLDGHIEEDSFMASLELCEGEPVYDFCWYPYMSASDPRTCVFATTTRDHPVHLWDAITGELRCSYRAYDSMDEITAAYSVAFNSDGTKLFCGYNKTLRIFDTSCPGREFKQHSTVTCTKDGQTGIISCLAFNPCNMGLLAAGSYDRTTAIYAEDNLDLLFVLHGQEGGVTQVQFSKDGNYLYTGGRKDPYIMCWDVRNTSGIVYKLSRLSTNTNQRIAFDIEPCGRHLGSGGQDGYCRVFDLQTGEQVTSFQAAEDTTNGFSFHPCLPLAVSTSGQRRFGTLDDDIENNTLNVLENCASVWSFACSWEN